MNYRGFEIIENDGGVLIKGVRDFDPVHIFECGQCFRWIRQDNGSYMGIVKDKAVNVSFEDGRLEISNSSFSDFTDLWYDYFDLGTDYSEIKKILTQKDEIMAKAVEFGHGIRILKQDIWETLISFIISANNRIPRIMKTVDAVSVMLGKEICFEGKSCYAFPGAHELSTSCITDLEACKGGFRCKYIHATAKMIENSSVNLDELKNMTTDEARDELNKLPGVGNKVADCTLLYSGTKRDVFPTDVWVKRVMEELYFKRNASFKEIQDFAQSYFGELSGVAQQYLFYYARENKIGAE